MRKRKHARILEGLRVQMVSIRRIPPPSLDVPSSSAPPLAFEPPLVSNLVAQQSSSCFSNGESFTYKKLFPLLVEPCKKSPTKDLRRSTRKKGKA